MKKIAFYLLLAPVVVNFGGCKKDTQNNTPVVALYGLWQITSSTPYPNTKFIRFGSNKVSKIYSQTTE